MAMLKQTIRQTQIGKQTISQKNNFVGNKSTLVLGIVDHESDIVLSPSSIDPRFYLYSNWFLWLPIKVLRKKLKVLILINKPLFYSHISFTKKAMLRW